MREEKMDDSEWIVAATAAAYMALITGTIFAWMGFFYFIACTTTEQEISTNKAKPPPQKYKSIFDGEEIVIIGDSIDMTLKSDAKRFLEIEEEEGGLQLKLLAHLLLNDDDKEIHSLAKQYCKE